MKYTSPPTTIHQQIELLESRGMLIEDKKRAEIFLNNVSYYRFSGYALHYEIFEERKRIHRFNTAASFDKVVSLYDFDSRLRKLLFATIETIEVTFRSQLCLQLSLANLDPHWPLKIDLFKKRFDHTKFRKECQKETERSKEVFIQNYCEKYNDPLLPASWMLIEIVSFGTWSRLFSSLKSEDLKKKVARYFKLPPYILQSWIHSLTVIRNLCAHHARLWNRSLTIKPKLTERMGKIYPKDSPQRKRMVLILDIILELLKPRGQYEDFIHEFNELMNNHPKVPITSMGLKEPHITLENGVRQ